MRVKKFEAKSMKEALQMVKTELGPDAVILAARDNRKSFGLAGETSVEVTAAVSENTLHKKKFVESRLRENDRERFQKSPARLQRQIIDQMTSERLQQKQAQTERRAITRLNYIDIHDDEPENASRPAGAQRAATHASGAPPPAGQAGKKRGTAVRGVNGRNVREVTTDFGTEEIAMAAEEEPQLAERAKARIRSAVREAWRAGIPTADDEQARERERRQARERAPATAAPLVHRPAVAPSNNEEREVEIVNLRNEISRLQSLIEGFQKVPQAFVGAHPGADYGIGYDLSFNFQKLLEAGISTENAVEILTRAQAEMDPMQIKKRPLVDAFVARWFLNAIQVVRQPYAGRVHCFVGGSGSGKTSTLVKVASHLVVKEKKKVAVLTTDSFKVGAADQLKIYCQILNVPFAIVRNVKEWEWVLSQLAHIDHILVDFPGLQLRDLDEIQLLKSLLPPASTQATSHIVVSATSKDGDALELARRYKVADFADVIFTNLDQSVQHGIIYNFQKKTGKPLHSFGTGTQLPEDFELATKERVLDLMFRLTRIRK
jgi:flagellar biosynthesis protein FlhF